jgi:AcrR family transcriptional regulator
MNESAEKQDRRTKRTHKLLADALITLALQHGYDKVSISDITKQADVSYSTFFRNFDDKDQLLMSLMRSVIDELRELITDEQDADTTGVVLFQHVARHDTLYQVLLGGLYSSAIAQQAQEIVAEQVKQQLKLSAVNAVPMDIAANHIAASTLGMVRWWLDQGMPYPPERMGLIYAALVLRPLRTMG